MKTLSGVANTRGKIAYVPQQAKFSIHKLSIQNQLKAWQNKNDLNDVTAAPFFVFFVAGSWEKDTKNGAAVTSLRSFLFRDDFNMFTNIFPNKLRFNYSQGKSLLTIKNCSD